MKKELKGLIEEIWREKVGKSFFYNAIKYQCYCAETVPAGAAEKGTFVSVSPHYNVSFRPFMK